MAKKAKFTNKNDDVTLSNKADGTIANPINAKNGDDKVHGGNGNDVIDGGKGNDKLWGDAGNDTLISKSGNDKLDGGDGSDTAVIKGNFADAVITEGTGSVTIEIGGRTITAKNIESFQFDDKTVSAVDLVNDAPEGTSTATLSAGTEDTAYIVKASDLLTGFSDQNKDTLSVTGLTASDGATVKDNGDGTYTITPAANDNGDVTLTFTVSDGKGGTVAGSNKVTFAAVNDAPTGTSTAALAAGTEDTAYVVKASDLLKGFSDADGDTLSVTGLTASDGATVKDNGDGTYTITPAANDNGDVTLTFTVSDGNGGTVAGSNKVNFVAVDELFVLTKDTDTPAMTADGDVVTGVVSALSSENTLNTLDVISDIGGTDTLKVDMKADFGGFTGSGKLSGVENIELTNSTGIARTFTGTGVTGTDKFTLTGAVNLAGLTEIDTVVAGTRTADLSIAYASKVTDGVADVLNLSVSGFGTIDNPATLADETDAVKITVAGIETTNLTASGSNALDLSGVASKTVNITGDGVTVTNLSATTSVLDASGVKGDMILALGGLSGATSVATGSGADTITLDAANDLAANAVLAGGTGADTLVVTSSAAAVTQYTQTGIETLAFGDQFAALTMSLKNTTGVTTLVALGEDAAAGDLNQNVTLANVGAGALELHLEGANGNGGAVLSSDGTGAASISVDTPASTATVVSPSVNKLDVALTAASSVSLSVASKMQYDGQVTASKATSVSVALDGAAGAGSSITAAKATSLVISSVNVASDLDLVAASATSLQITNAKDLDLATGAATSLGSLESLTSSGAGDLNMTGIALAKLNSATIANTGDVDLGNIGSTTLGYGVTISSTGAATFDVGSIMTDDFAISLTVANAVGAVTSGVIDADDGNVTVAASTNAALTLNTIDGSAISVDASSGTTLGIGAITGAKDVSVDASAGTNLTLAAVSGQNVTLDLGASGTAGLNAVTGTKSVSIDVSDVLGAVTYGGDITVGGDFTFVGSELKANDLSTHDVKLTGTVQTLSLTGGIDNDTFDIIGATTSTAITIKGELDLGSDVVTVDLATNNLTANATITMSGLSGYDVSTITASDTKETTVALGTGTDADTIKYSASQKLTVTGFRVENDFINVKALAGGTVASVVDVLAGGTVGDASDTKIAYVFADGATASGGATVASYTDLVDVLDFLNSAMTHETGDVDGVAIINDLVNGKAYIYEMDVDSTNDANIDAVTLVGVISTNSAVTAADFSIA